MGKTRRHTVASSAASSSVASTAPNAYTSIFGCSNNTTTNNLESARLESYTQLHPTTDQSIQAWHRVLDHFQDIATNEARSGLLICMKMQQESEAIRLVVHDERRGGGKEGEDNTKEILTRSTVYIGPLASFSGDHVLKAQSTLKATNEAVAFLRSLLALLSDFRKRKF